MLEHLLQRVVGDAPDGRGGLQVAGQADLDRDPLAGDVLGQVVARSACGSSMSGSWIMSAANRKVPWPMRLAWHSVMAWKMDSGPVGLAGVHGLPEEVAVRVLVGRLVVDGRVAGLLAGEVEADDRQALAGAPARRPRAPFPGRPWRRSPSAGA